MIKGYKAFLAAVMMTVSVVSFAQKKEYEPLTTWPYLYEEFQPGCITTFKGADVWYDELNVNLMNGKAHFVQNGKIMEADMTTVATLKIGDKTYMCASGALVEVLNQREKGAVVCSRRVDTDAMNKSDIGYGKSSLASTQNVSLNVITNDMEMMMNKSFDVVRDGKESGDPLIVKEVDGIIFQGMFVPALRTEILDIVGVDKDAVKKYLKDNKVKLSNTDHLAALVDYLYSLL